ncbi:MAG TPA: hypothetical protein VK980_13445 [Sphingomonas sp.]|nr:hypothetical protein [Sphingomonas sp.]
MARDYHEMLDLAAELQDYNGFLGTEALKQRNQLRTRFDGTRRRFVYERFHEGIDHAAIWPSVSADLDRISGQRVIREDAVDYVREELANHIERQANNTPFKRFVVRWGPPAGMVLVTISYIVAKLKVG